jgi:hypothetical protein
MIAIGAASASCAAASRSWARPSATSHERVRDRNSCDLDVVADDVFGKLGWTPPVRFKIFEWQQHRPDKEAINDVFISQIREDAAELSTIRGIPEGDRDFLVALARALPMGA